MRREFTFTDRDILDMIGDVIGASVAAATVGADYGKKAIKTANNTVKNTADKVKECVKQQTECRTPKLLDYIDHIIAQDTTTVVFWKDGTKTVVKCSADDPYDYEKGLAMAILKYVFGNRYFRDMTKLMKKNPYVDTTKVKVEKKPETKKSTTTKSTAKKTTSKKTTAKKTTSAKKTSTKPAEVKTETNE